MHNMYLFIIFYILYALLHVPVYLHDPRGVLSLYFVKVTKFIKITAQ